MKSRPFPFKTNPFFHLQRHPPVKSGTGIPQVRPASSTSPSSGSPFLLDRGLSTTRGIVFISTSVDTASCGHPAFTSQYRNRGCRSCSSDPYASWVGYGWSRFCVEKTKRLEPTQLRAPSTSSFKQPKVPVCHFRKSSRPDAW